MAKLYEPGLAIKDENSLALHRNENLFIEKEWFEYLTKEASLKANIRFYPDPNYITLREELAKLHNVDLENIYVGNGADGVLADVLGYLKNVYNEMTILDIGFPVYAILAERLKYSIKKINRTETDKIDVNELVVFDSPNSITGEVFSSKIFQTILNKKGSFLIWDNTYGEFADDKITSFFDNLIYVKSFSKYFGLAGLRLGYCIASKDLIKKLALYKDVYNVNSMVEVMALEVLKYRNKFEFYKNQMLNCKKRLEKILLNLGFILSQSKGNFVFIKHSKFSAKWLENKFFEKNILIRRFSNPLIENYVRIAIPPENKFNYFVDSLEQIISSKSDEMVKSYMK
ncbi:MAG: hypothetical protein A2888_01000 [Chlamydiae bacterium RIFCSPLOWO2_01_FULL_28_7]|nr:MAG: hypothetical protein A2888_01000 [Chlamydiae bacterium RIFCSPLOWO2_01_FULL_28_7]